MSSPKFRTPLRVTLNHSRVLAVLLVSTHLAAAATLLLLPAPMTIAGGLLIVVSLLHTIRTHIFHTGPYALQGLIWQPSGRIIALGYQGIEQEVTIAKDIFIHPTTIVLNLVFKDRTRRTLVLLSDNVSAAIHRELRKRLRMTTRGVPADGLNH